jgi:hypothetical protein
MLTVIVRQVIVHVIRLSTFDDAVELSELLVDAEEEQENEEKLIEFEEIECQDFDLLKDNTIGGRDKFSRPIQKRSVTFAMRNSVKNPGFIKAHTT